MLFKTDDAMPDEMVGGLEGKANTKSVPKDVEQAHADMKKAHEQRKAFKPTLLEAKSQEERSKSPTKDEAGNEFAPGVSYDSIPFSIAANAHRGTSFVPEKRGKQRQQDFAHRMNEVYADLKKSIGDDPEKQKSLDTEWSRFVASAKSKYIDALHADSRTMSSMITGPARFPTASNRKKLDSAMNKWNEYSEFVERAQKAIRRELFPEDAPKKIGDAGTGSHIETELDRRKALQQQMKDANKILKDAGIFGYWRHGNQPKYKPGHSRESVMKKLMELPGVDEAKAKELTRPGVTDHIGYESFELSNNNANIRRYEKQAVRQQRFESEAKAASESGDAATEHAFEGGKVHLDYADNRIRIAHDSKPSSDVIAKLKSRGFRWSPANKAWQRQLTNAAKYDAHAITGVPLEKLTPKSPETEKHSIAFAPVLLDRYEVRNV